MSAAELGPLQKAAMAELYKHGHWIRGRGPWLIHDMSTTQRVLDSLVDRGLVLCTRRELTKTYMYHVRP